MQGHHYLGALGKIGETLWYVATWRQGWVALPSFSTAASKIAARDPLDWLELSAAVRAFAPCWPTTPNITFCPTGIVRTSPRTSSLCASDG